MSQARRAADELREFHRQYVVKIALDLDRRIVLKTPVDTGRARANWIASTGSPATQKRNTVDQSGGSTINDNARKIQKVRFGKTIWLSNNLPYIGVLEDGSSLQAPAGMVRTSIRETERVFGSR